MEPSFDPEADAAYVRLRERTGPRRTEVAEDGTVVDYEDESGDVIGYEFLSVTFRGLDAFHTVPEAARLLVSRAIDVAKAEGRPAKVSDTD